MEELRRVDVSFKLASHQGLTPNARDKTWFFAVPAERDVDSAWQELLHRIFYDANVAMRRREPNDANWLALVGYSVTPVDARLALSWNGATDRPTTEQYLPWFPAEWAKVWEWSTSLIVDAAGRYDGVSAYDYSELLAFRALARGEVDDATVVAFLSKLYPGTPGRGAEIFAERDARLRNIVEIRPAPAFRRAPGSTPVASGPPSPADVALG